MEQTAIELHRYIKLFLYFQHMQNERDSAEIATNYSESAPTPLEDDIYEYKCKKCGKTTMYSDKPGKKYNIDQCLSDECLKIQL